MMLIYVLVLSCIMALAHGNMLACIMVQAHVNVLAHVMLLALVRDKICNNFFWIGGPPSKMTTPPSPSEVFRKIIQNSTGPLCC